MLKHISDFHSDSLTDQALLETVQEYTNLFEVFFTIDENSELNKFDSEFVDYSQNSMFTYLNSTMLIGIYMNSEQKKKDMFKGFNRVVERVNTISHLLSENNSKEYIGMILQK